MLAGCDNVGGRHIQGQATMLSLLSVTILALPTMEERERNRKFFLIIKNTIILLKGAIPIENILPGGLNLVLM